MKEYLQLDEDEASLIFENNKPAKKLFLINRFVILPNKRRGEEAREKTVFLCGLVCGHVMLYKFTRYHEKPRENIHSIDVGARRRSSN